MPALHNLSNAPHAEAALGGDTSSCLPSISGARSMSPVVTVGTTVACGTSIGHLQASSNGKEGHFHFPSSGLTFHGDFDSGNLQHVEMEEGSTNCYRVTVRRDNEGTAHETHVGRVRVE